jgi:hypothetical protein
MARKLKSSGMQSGPGPLLLVGVAVFIFWGFGYETVWDRLTLVLNGVVISYQYLPPTTLRHGSGAIYTIRDPDGRDTKYIAGATDASLPKHIPVGTYVDKRKWELSYLLDGKRVDDFPLYFYMGAFGLACGCLLWAVLQWLARRRSLQSDRSIVGD